MKIVKAASWPVNIYMAGSRIEAVKCCKEYCDKVPLCVRVYKSSYIYTNGSEEGFTVSFINYPRFPKTSMELESIAIRLGKKLLTACEQESFSIETPDTTIWYSIREEDETVS